MERATYSVNELARVLGCGRYTVLRMLRDNIVPHIRPQGTRKYIIPRAAVDRWLANAGQAQVVPWPQGGYQA